MRATVYAGMMLAIGLATGAVAGAPDFTPDARFAALKDVLARNQASLQRFCWNTHTEVRVKGLARKSIDDVCRFGPDGTVYRTPLAAPAPRNEILGFRRRFAETSPAPVQDPAEGAVALVYGYMSPLPARLEALFQAASALFVKRPGTDVPQLQFRDYLKPGDLLVLSFDPVNKSLRTFEATSYLEDETDAVTLHGTFEGLPDGTRYPASGVLNSPRNQLQVVTVNANYRRVWQ